MKKKLILEAPSAKMLKIGLFIVNLAYILAAIYIYLNMDKGMMTVRYAASIIEHVTMTLLIVVSASLLLDLHIKQS